LFTSILEENHVYRPQISLLELFTENIARGMTGAMVSSNTNGYKFMITLKGPQKWVWPLPCFVPPASR